AGGHQVGAGLIEQPVRLRLAGLEPGRWVEAVEHALPIQEQQPILRSTLRREGQQRQLVGSQHLLVVQAERDLPVALGQMPRQLEHAVGAGAPTARQRRIRLTLNRCPSLSESVRTPNHAVSRPIRPSSGNGTTLPMPLAEAPSITPTERPSRRFTATSSSNPASSDTTSSYCAADNGTRRGGNSPTSPLELFFANHRRASRGAKLKRQGRSGSRPALYY